MHGMLATLWLLWLGLYIGHLQGSVGKLNSGSEYSRVSSFNSSQTQIPRSVLANTGLSLFPALGRGASDCSSPWSCCSSKVCTKQCNNGEILQDVLKCGSRGNLTVRNCNCVTYNSKENLTEVGPCIYNCRSGMHGRKNKSLYIALSPNKMDLNDFMCGNEFNRAGTLCGQCKKGYHPLVYSFDMNCVQCLNGMSNWWKYVLAAYLPLTLFFFIVVFFEVSITSHLNGFVFCSQTLSLPTVARMLLLATRENRQTQTTLRYVATFFGIWNLDFFRALKFTATICLGTDTLQTLSLDFLVGAYPLLLLVVTYFLIELHDRNFKVVVILWKPFGRLFGLFRKQWEIRTSLIDAFATFFLLSSMKFLSVSYDLLVPMRVFQLNSIGGHNYTFRLYYDPTVPYLGRSHLPYAITAIVVLVLFVLTPGILLLLYPLRLFQRFLNLFPIRWHILHTFVDSYQGCYKDGTEPGTRDCRGFASLFFLLRLLVMFIYAFSKDSAFLPMGTIAIILVALLFILAEPFKRNASHFSYEIVIFLLLLALVTVSVAGMTEADFKRPEMLLPFNVTAVLSTVSLLVYMCALILNWIYRNGRFGLETIRRLQAWRRGYVQLV